MSTQADAVPQVPPNLKTDRKDHYLPQCYLRGFIDPAREKLPKPLWKLDIPSQKWAERSTSAVGFSTGFYDYAGSGSELGPLEPADTIFLELENGFPQIRAKLLALKGFRNWKKHLNFLLRFMQMIRARSPLYFEQKGIEGKAIPTWTVDKVGDDRKTITLRSMEPSPPPAPFIKNRTIMHMREEIKKGADWLDNFNWALRYCESVAEPFVTSEAPFVLDEVPPAVTNITQAVQCPETLIYFPICWQACLFGSLRRFDLGTGKLETYDMKTFRGKYRHFAQKFLVSPTKLDDITGKPQAK